MSVQSGISSRSERVSEQADFLLNMPGVLDSKIEKDNAASVAAASRPNTRKSCREKRQTQKMMEFTKQEATETEERFTDAYEEWKSCVKEVRTMLKCKCSEEDLCSGMDAIEKLESVVGELYLQLRSKVTPSQRTRRRMDACTAVTADLTKLMKQRLTEDEEEFDAEAEKYRLRALLDCDCARSIYGSTVSRVSVSSKHSNNPSETQSISAKRMEAVAELSAKKAELKMQAVIDAQRQQLRDLESKRDLEVIEARVRAYSIETSPEEQNCDPANHEASDLHLAETRDPEGPSTKLEDSLSQMLQSSMSLSRLPTPEPTVFHGDPLEFIEWSCSFRAIIERRCQNPTDRLFYLRQYIGGEAKSVLEGSSYRKDGDSYNQVWEKLNSRYGHPFILQRAFRQKLHRWPRIGAKEHTKLRNFGDFLQSCSEAMPHIKGLEILNDCEENQKLLAKLPDWLMSRWNRLATEELDQTGDYPSFHKFTEFICKEARIVCNPVSSVLAVRCSEGNPLGEAERPKADTLVTNMSKTATPDNWNLKCTYCGGGHSLHRCLRLAEKSAEEKREFVFDNKLCFACLRKGHNSKDCKKRATCSLCRGGHPTPLHENRPSPWRGGHPTPLHENRPLATDPSVRSGPQNEENTSSFSCSMNNDGGGESTSMIVPVWISSPSTSTSETLAYALLDTQSSHTFADQGVCRGLQTKMESVKLSLSTMMGRNSIIESSRVTGLRVRGLFSDTCIDLPPSYTRDLIPLERSHIPTHKTAAKWKHLAAITQEMPSLMDCGVGLLIGYDCSRALVPQQIITGGEHEPYAIKTALGWSIVGTTARCLNSSVTGLCHRMSVRELPPVTPLACLKVLEADFADTGPGEKSVSQEDIQFLNILKTNIHINECGHIEMPLPFRVRPNLPDNRKLAIIRLRHLKGKIDRDPKLKRDYLQFMEGIFNNGDVEKVDRRSEAGNVWYIPHQGVYHPKKPEKIRVVFDASAKYQGTALNDHLLTGPDLTNGLIGVLCRFRKHPVAIMCDVEKMFHQFHVSEEDRDYLRFLWWKDGDTSSEPEEYRMKVHLFGAASSPGCANYGMKYLARHTEKEYPAAANFIRKHFYVDDGLISVESVEEARKLVKEAQALCARGNLHLHKFVSNSRKVLSSIDVTERATEIKNVDLNVDILPAQRVLGVEWNTESDAFSFRILLADKPTTRRGILSMIAAIYDPLGFLSPFILLGKKVLQEMCQRGMNWDEPLPDELKPRWESWVNDLKNLEKIRIPRCYGPENFGEILSVELHHFSDASSQGYGQCSYIRWIGKNKVHCTLVMSKSRVAPTKVVTIPRLELTAAVISAAVGNILKEELELKIDREYFWTDSRVVLGYINNEARRFHVFVANRVQRIRGTTDTRQWHYVATADNPADHASRGLMVAELINSNWFTGPKFLWDKEIETEQGSTELLVGDPEVKVIQVFKTEAARQTNLQALVSRFSKWTTAVNVIARIQRLAARTSNTRPLSLEEKGKAKLAIIRLAQQDAFMEEINLLNQGVGGLPCSHQLYQFDPFLQDNIMRVGGRLRRALVPLELKHPMILPKDGVVTHLIIAHYHEQIQHQGRGQTLNEVRANGYWIIGGSSVVAQYIRQCVTCRRVRRQPEEQRMADLPDERVNPSPPFTYCGMDCFGPYLVKNGRKESKRYGLLFTCLCSRAIHIEMLEDMTTDAFINALRCFIAIRGAVRQIRSDQGSNFIGARNELKRALREVDKDKVAQYLADRQCDFSMNTPDSSHAGGVWERQIRTVKSVLASALALSVGRLDDASLRTFFYEAMSIVNSRPLTVDTLNDPTSMEPLTPNHLLTMKSSIPMPPPGQFIKEDLYARKRWRRVQYLAEQFWSRWRKEYVANIALRQRWHAPKRNVRVGDIVIIKEDNLPRNKWKLSRVLDVYTDDDGLVRKAKIQTGKHPNSPSTIERPIQKLVVLIEAT